MPTSDREKKRGLESLLDLDEGDLDLWRPEDLGAVLEHQLHAPLEADLSILEPGSRERIKAIQPDHGPPIRSFRDLFEHPHPPVELLVLTKRFAKHCRYNSRDSLPVEVASVLYLLAIVVAQRRCGQRISGLDAESLQAGLDWVQRLPWLDDATRSLFRHP